MTPRRGSTRPTSSPDYSSRDSPYRQSRLLNPAFHPPKPPSRLLGVRLGPTPQPPPPSLYLGQPQPHPQPPAPHVTSVHAGGHVQPSGGGFQPVVAPYARGRRLQLKGDGGGGGEEPRGRGGGKANGEREREQGTFERLASSDKDAGPDMGLQLQGFGINQHLERNPAMHTHAPTHNQYARNKEDRGRKGMGGTLKRAGKVISEGPEEYLLLGRPSC